MSSYANDPIYQRTAAEIAAEMAAASAPIERAIAGTQADEQRALSGIGNLFSGLQPQVEESTRWVGQQYDQAMTAEQGIYSAANQRLAQMREQRATDAQKMAQMMGGPVAVGEFTAGVEPNQQYYAQTGAGQLLHSLALAQAGKQEAAAFSGKVFPLLRTEQEADARATFGKRIADLRGSLSDLQASKTSSINSRFFERQKAEREYELDKQTMELNKVKADRDWKATLKSLAQDNAKLKLAQAESRRADSILTGKYKGKTTQAATAQAAQIAQSKRDAKLREKEINASIQNMSANQRLEAQRLGLSERELAAKIWDMNNTGQLKKVEMSNNQRQLAMEIIDQATNPAQGKAIKQTLMTEVDRMTALTNKKAFGVQEKNPQTGKMETHYYLDRTVQVPGASIPSVQDPAKLYELLVGFQIPPKMAEKMVETKLGIGENFVPGKVKYTRAEMQSMPFSQLRGVAVKLGYQVKGDATRKKLISYVASRVGKAAKK
jgi:hypothetical protein